MEVCGLCNEQSKKQRYTDPHEYLKPSGDRRAIQGGMTGGYEEQDYICDKCGAEFTYSNDKNDYGWILHNKS